MASTHTFHYDLIVIGSGASGSVAATTAARAGKRVALIEGDTFGGESSNWSDVPLAALLHAGRLYHNAKTGNRFGLRTAGLGYNYPALRAWKEQAVSRTGAANNRKFYEKLGISTFHGRAHFLTPHEITVNRQHLSARHFVIATGSAWGAPAIKGIGDVPYLTPRTVLTAARPPKSITIVGGGEDGVVLAQLLATFGTKVFIVEQQSRMLPSQEPEVGELLDATLLEQGITTLTRSKVVAVHKDGTGVKVIVSRGGATKFIRTDEVLVTSHYTPATDLGLENAGIAHTAAGITVNRYLQTTNKHIYAAGSVLDRHTHTHEAITEGHVSAHNILHPTSRITANHTASPHVIFAHPEIAQVGITVREARKSQLTVRTATAPINIVAKSHVTDHSDGFVKLIVNETGVIVGATIAAPHASEIIHELALAVKAKVKASTLASTPHAFLSWSEAVRVAASKLT